MRFTLLIVLVFGIFGCKSKQNTAAPKKEGRKKILVGAVIEGISISSFPKYGKDGEAWDAYAPFASDPDLFAVVDWNGNRLYKSEVYNECIVGTTVNFTSGFPLVVKPFDQPISLEIFDEDGISANDNVGYFAFTLFDFKGQTTIELISGDLKVQLKMNWIYN
jgi:hypothetical protein